MTTYYNNPTDNNSLSHNLVRTLYFDRSGVLWLGTEAGLNKMTGANRFIRFLSKENDPKSLSHNVINTIFEDSFGQIWVGTVGGGLNKLDQLTNQFTSYQNDPNNPISILEPDTYVFKVRGYRRNGRDKFK